MDLERCRIAAQMGRAWDWGEAGEGAGWGMLEWEQEGRWRELGKGKPERGQERERRGNGEGIKRGNRAQWRQIRQR